MALGTLALVNVKVSGGPSAAIAATTVNASANASRQDGFPFLMVSSSRSEVLKELTSNSELLSRTS
jgi:hypothetical protein